MPWMMERLAQAAELPIYNLPMSDALAEEEQELKSLVKSLDKTCTRYKMEIPAKEQTNDKQ